MFPREERKLLVIAIDLFLGVQTTGMSVTQLFHSPSRMARELFVVRSCGH